MQQLARRMFKSVSTMTPRGGTTGPEGYIKRRQDPEDRRIVNVSITPQGKAIVTAISADMIETQKSILQTVPADEWQGPSRCWRPCPEARGGGRRRAVRCEFLCPHICMLQ